MDNQTKELVNKYLKEGRLMSVATVSGDQPWNFTAYYASDDHLNIYWISPIDTRHSKEIQANKKVAVSIPIKFDNITVVGLQVEGDAKLIEDTGEIKEAIKIYCDKHQRGEEWYKDFIAGKNIHKAYKITPRLFVLYDRVNSPDHPRQEFKLR